jgi:hypothetical protein
MLPGKIHTECRKLKKQISAFWNLTSHKSERIPKFYTTSFGFCRYLPDLGPNFTSESMLVMYAFTQGHPGQTVVLSRNILNYCAENE